jgi:hypothetical protein
MKTIVSIENSDYSQKLRKIKNITFYKIIEISAKYVEKFINESDIWKSLKRGENILKTERQLYQYNKSFGYKHISKLEDAFDNLKLNKNKRITINIIDWGCGQALATCVFMDYIKEEKLKINIANIILIEPSEIALSRGILHIDVLKENEINITPVNKELDNLEQSDLKFDNDNPTLHLFSNILDMESFNLDKLLEIISNSQKGSNVFLCTSPNIITRNARLDSFYEYFNDKFKIQPISSEVDNSRYEKIFKINF